MSLNKAAGENGELHEFDVTIVETYEKTVRVQAVDLVDAKLTVNEEWKAGEHELDDSFCYRVDFEAELVERELTRELETHVKGENHDMNGDNTGITASDASTAPLSENQYVQELFSVLQENGRDTTGLAALIGHVSEMENFVKRAEDKIAEMKSQLSEMKEVQNHPVKATLQTAIKNLELKVAEVRERLTELKNNIVEAC